MKCWKGFIWLCMLCLFVTGCGFSSSPNDQSNAGGANGDMKESKVDFEVVQVSDLPETLQSKIDKLTMSKVSGHFIAKAEQKTFIVIALGERNTGGYSVEIDQVVQKGNALKVYAKEVSPPKGAMTIQVITYPFTIIAVKGDKFDPIEVYQDDKLSGSLSETK